MRFRFGFLRFRFGFFRFCFGFFALCFHFFEYLLFFFEYLLFFFEHLLLELLLHPLGHCPGDLFFHLVQNSFGDAHSLTFFGKLRKCLVKFIIKFGIFKADVVIDEIGQHPDIVLRDFHAEQAPQQAQFDLQALQV